MSDPTSEDNQVPQQSKQSAIARQVLKFKKIPKSSAHGQELQLEKIIGITSKGRNSFVCSAITGDLAYPAGSIAVIYNPKANKQVKYFFTPSKKSISALTFSPDGKYI